MKDRTGKLLQNGDVVNIHQTVNGENLFVVINTEDLDIRYAYDIDRKYEYDKNYLLAPFCAGDDTEFEIVGNINKYILDLRNEI